MGVRGSQQLSRAPLAEETIGVRTEPPLVGAARAITPEEYAAAHPSAGGCRVCALPPGVRAEVERARRELRMSYGQVRGWVFEATGTRLSESGIRRHFQEVK